MKLLFPSTRLSPSLGTLSRYHRKRSPQPNRHYSTEIKLKWNFWFGCCLSKLNNRRGLNGEQEGKFFNDPEASLPVSPWCCTWLNYFHSSCRPFFFNWTKLSFDLFKTLHNDCVRKIPYWLDWLSLHSNSRHAERTLKFCPHPAKEMVFKEM